jgi:hypothetical protein
MTLRGAPFAAAVATCALLAATARGQDPLDRARSQYEMGIRLFDAGQNEQALIEFKAAFDTKPRPAALFMMAQCEYTLGQLRAALDHYQRYARENPSGQYVELARYRIEAIGNRQSQLFITTVPAEVQVRIEPDQGTAGEAQTGQAPSTFAVRRGRHRITLSKAGYLTKQVSLDVDIAEAKPLLFTLDPIRARLEIETVPADATLYVNGNRARNPYRQNVDPGQYEIFAEAKQYAPRTQALVLGPAERKLLTGRQRFILEYEQRSGLPELSVASAIIGGLFGGVAVAAAVGPSLDDSKSRVSTWSFVGGGAAAGVVGGILGASAAVPRTIPDNQALFVVGGMWMGLMEGALTGIVVDQATAGTTTVTTRDGPREVRLEPATGHQVRGAFLGALPGLALGTTAGALLSPRAPTYGRVALIQSAAAGGVMAGYVTAMALRWRPRDWQKLSEGSLVEVQHSSFDRALPALIGLDLGLGAGLLGAYASERSATLSWQRVALVDLAVAAGAVAGAIGGCAFQSACIDADRASDAARAPVGAAALGGAALGLVGGDWLTRGVDASSSRATSTLQVAAVPMAIPRTGAVPGLGLAGVF